MRTPIILGCSSGLPATLAATGFWWETAPAAGGCPRRLSSGDVGEIFLAETWLEAKIKSCSAVVSSRLWSIRGLNRVKREAEVWPAAPNFSKEHLPTPDPWPCLALRKTTPHTYRKPSDFSFSRFACKLTHSIFCAGTFQTQWLTSFLLVCLGNGLKIFGWQESYVGLEQMVSVVAGRKRKKRRSDGGGRELNSSQEPGWGGRHTWLRTRIKSLWFIQPLLCPEVPPGNLPQSSRADLPASNNFCSEC